MMNRPQNPEEGKTPSRTSKLPAGRVVLLVLGSLLAVTLVIICRLSFVVLQTNKSFQTLKEENEALRRNISGELREQPTCPPPPAVQKETFLKCEAGWEPHRGKCYSFSTNKSSWYDSRRSCIDLGSDLVKIDSREEQMFLLGRLSVLMQHHDDMFWIGLTDSVEEDKWFWVDGSPLDQSLRFWGYGQPDDKGVNYQLGADCVRMGLNEGADNLKCWHDRNCDYPQKSICEKKA